MLVDVKTINGLPSFQECAAVNQQDMHYQDLHKHCVNGCFSLLVKAICDWISDGHAVDYFLSQQYVQNLN